MKQRRPRASMLYRAAALVSVAVVFVGFSRSYYLRPLFRHTSLELLLQVHGAVMTLWFLLFAVQVSLVAQDRVRAHRRMGIVGAILAAILCVLALLTTLYSAKQIGDLRPPTPFLGLVLISFLPFPILVAAGIYNRRRPDIHRRLMLLATLGILGAALVRFPLNLSDTSAALFMLGGTDTLILAGVLVDTLEHRKLNAAFVGGCTCIVFFQGAAGLLAPTAAWAGTLSWLVEHVPGSF